MRPSRRLLLHWQAELGQEDRPVDLHLDKQFEEPRLGRDKSERNFRPAAQQLVRRLAVGMDVNHRVPVLQETHDVRKRAHHWLQSEARFARAIRHSQAGVDRLAGRHFGPVEPQLESPAIRRRFHLRDARRRSQRRDRPDDNRFRRFVASGGQRRHIEPEQIVARLAGSEGEGEITRTAGSDRLPTLNTIMCL